MVLNNLEKLSPQHVDECRGQQGFNGLTQIPVLATTPSTTAI